MMGSACCATCISSCATCISSCATCISSCATCISSCATHTEAAATCALLRAPHLRTAACAPPAHCCVRPTCALLRAPHLRTAACAPPAHCCVCPTCALATTTCWHNQAELIHTCHETTLHASSSCIAHLHAASHHITSHHCRHSLPPSLLPCHTLPHPQEQSGELPKPDTLKSLSTYLTLQRAKEEYGFDPAKYGMSEKKAGDIAQVGAAGYGAAGAVLLDSGQRCAICFACSWRLALPLPLLCMLHVAAPPRRYFAMWC